MGRGLAAFLATSFMNDVAMDIIVPIFWWPRSFIRTVLELLLRLLCYLRPASHSLGRPSWSPCWHSHCILCLTRFRCSAGPVSGTGSHADKLSLLHLLTCSQLPYCRGAAQSGGRWNPLHVKEAIHHPGRAGSAARRAVD